MIRKIICPTDLSPAARNAVAYAAKLSQVNKATIELLYVEPVTVPELVFTGRRKLREVLSWSAELNALAHEVNRMFHVSCSCDIETANKGLYQVLNEKANSETLIVVGTNGADSLYQQLFGSNAYNIAINANAAILVVPENCEFRTVRKVAFGWDYKLSPALITGIREFAASLNAQIDFVHISKHDSQISKDVFRAVKNEVKEQAHVDEEIKFHQVYDHNIADGLFEFMKKGDAEMLAFSVKSGQFLVKVFGAIGKADELPSFPVLILHN